MPVSKSTRELGTGGGKEGGGELIRMRGVGGGNAAKAVQPNIEGEVDVTHKGQTGLVGLVQGTQNLGDEAALCMGVTRWEVYRGQAKLMSTPRDGKGQQTTVMLSADYRGRGRVMNDQAPSLD